MWITYIANGLAVLAAGLALFIIAARHQYKPHERTNLGFWLGVLMVSAAIVVDFPWIPDDLPRSLLGSYTAALVITILMAAFLHIVSEDGE